MSLTVYIPERNTEKSSGVISSRLQLIRSQEKNSLGLFLTSRNTAEFTPRKFKPLTGGKRRLRSEDHCAQYKSELKTRHARGRHFIGNETSKHASCCNGQRSPGCRQKLPGQLGIVILPLVIIVEGKEYLDGIDLFPVELYQKMRTQKIEIKTAAPNVGQ